MGEAFDDVYVINYDFENDDYSTTAPEFETLIKNLTEIGLHTEVRLGYDASLLVFVKAPRRLLGNAVYKSRVKDWLYMISQTRPEGNKDTSIYGDTEAENLRSMFHLVTWSKLQGGAGVTPQHGQWKNVKSVFPMHNQTAVKSLLAKWTKQLYLRTEDLDDIRSIFGEKVAFYFAFLRAYSLFLLFPAITGLLSWVYLPHYSLFYALITSLWCIVFTEYWKHQEVDLSLRWDVKGVGALKINRIQYTWEKEVVDPITGERTKYFPAWKHVTRQLLQIPFGLVAFLALGALITLVFAVEIFINELYDGPFKFYLGYIPTILLSACLPAITSIFENVAVKLTEYENHRTRDAHEMALTQKTFMLNFVTSFLPIILTAFIYVPFGDRIAPYLERSYAHLRPWFSDASPTSLESKAKFQVDPSRLRDEVIALTVTGQLLSYGEELILPYLKHQLTRRYRNYRSGRSKAGTSEVTSLWAKGFTPQETAFIERARNEADLEPYDVQEDLRQMVVQYGYLALFAPVWPLVPVGFLINNWVELRSDFLKICIECQRPPPIRMDTIGPWLDSLGFLTWLGSIVTAAIVHIFGNNSNSNSNSNNNVSSSGRTTVQLNWWGLPLIIFFSEHVYLAVRSIVAFTFRRIGSDSIRKNDAEKYMMRKRVFDEYSIREESLANNSLTASDEARIHFRRPSRVVTFPVDAHHDFLSRLGNGPLSQFWTRQNTAQDSINAGLELMKIHYKTMEAKKEA